MTSRLLPIIEPAALRPADVFLSLGNSDLSAGIHQLDGGDYSHGALWSGSEVIEATLPVVRQVELSALTKRSLYVDVYRARAPVPKPEVIVAAARGFLDRPYGAVNLGVCTLATAITSWMPGDWSKLNLMLGVGELGRLIGVVSQLVKQVTATLSVTCVELVGRSYMAAQLPLDVQLDTPGTFEPAAFLKAVKEVLGRLPEDIRGDAGRKNQTDLLWLAQLEQRTSPLAPSAADSWGPVRRQWEELLAEEGARSPSRPSVPGSQTSVYPEHLERPVTEIRALNLRVGVDWPAGLLTPRLLQTSPSLQCVGRLRGE